MKTRKISMLPAKDFVFPMLRPLLTIIKCIKSMDTFADTGSNPVVLRRECLSNTGYLENALTELCGRAGIAAEEHAPIREQIHDPALWSTDPENHDRLESLLNNLVTFCKKHKSELGRAYRQDKQFFNNLYKKSVLKRRILIIHSPGNAPDALSQTLSTGCYYEVDTLPVEKALEKSEKHHITLFLCTGAEEAARFLSRSRRMGVSLFLSDLGRQLAETSLNLSRVVANAQKDGMRFISSPFVTMKVLPAIEEAYINKLEAFDRDIAAMEETQAEADGKLFAGQAEAVLYAEVIVEKAWQKTAGYATEQALSD